MSRGRTARDGESRCRWWFLGLEDKMGKSFRLENNAKEGVSQFILFHWARSGWADFLIWRFYRGGGLPSDEY